MIYKLSKISSEIYDENNNLVPKDTNNPVYIDFINNGGIYEEFEGTEEEKNHEKTQELNQLREQTNELLSKTDWAFIRSIDDSSEVNEIPIEVINERAVIRANHEVKKQEIITKYS